MNLISYVTFDGTCADAMAFYADALGGEVEALMRFGDMPDRPDWVTDANSNRVAHARVRLPNGQALFASDSAGIAPFEGHAGFSLQISIDDPDKGRDMFNKLGEGGTVEMPFASTFWAKGFGTLTDRFGVPWMVNCE
jgi:PhnB protein